MHVPMSWPRNRGGPQLVASVWSDMRCVEAMASLPRSAAFTRGCRGKVGLRAVERRVVGAGRALLSVVRGGEVLVELDQVVGGGHQPPFGPCGRSSASGEAGESAVVFG